MNAEWCEKKPAHRQKKEPQGRKKTVKRLADGDFFSVADKSHQPSDDLRRTQRSLHFPLVVAHQIKTIVCNAADPVKH